MSAAVDYQKIDLMIGDMEFTNVVTGDSGGDTDSAGIENNYLVFSLGGGFQF